MMKHLEKGDNTKTYLDSLVANGQASLTSVRHSKVE